MDWITRKEIFQRPTDREVLDAPFRGRRSELPSKCVNDRSKSSELSILKAELTQLQQLVDERSGTWDN